MRVLKQRWGEVTVKKQSTGGKNKFDVTKSFSVLSLNQNYAIEEYTEILKIATDLTDKMPFQKLKKELNNVVSNG